MYGQHDESCLTISRVIEGHIKSFLLQSRRCPDLFLFSVFNSRFFAKEQKLLACLLDPRPASIFYGCLWRCVAMTFLPSVMLLYPTFSWLPITAAFPLRRTQSQIPHPLHLNARSFTRDRECSSWTIAPTCCSAPHRV